MATPLCFKLQMEVGAEVLEDVIMKKNYYQIMTELSQKQQKHSVVLNYLLRNV